MRFSACQLSFPYCEPRAEGAILHFGDVLHRAIGGGGEDATGKCSVKILLDFGYIVT